MGLDLLLNVYDHRPVVTASKLGKHLPLGNAVDVICSEGQIRGACGPLRSREEGGWVIRFIDDNQLVAD